MIELCKMDQNHRSLHLSLIGYMTLIKRIYPKNDDIDGEKYSNGKRILVRLMVQYATALHPIFTHLENMNSCIRMLFVDFSSAFNTISPMKLFGKLNTLGFSTTLCTWTLDFLAGRAFHRGAIKLTGNITN